MSDRVQERPVHRRRVGYKRAAPHGDAAMKTEEVRYRADGLDMVCHLVLPGRR